MPATPLSRAVDSLRERCQLRHNELSGKAEFLDGGQWKEAGRAFRTALRLDAGACDADASSAIDYVARESPVHPVREWLVNELPAWDTIARLKDLVPAYFRGVGEYEMLREAGTSYAISAVQRVLSDKFPQSAIPVSIGYSPIEALETLHGPEWASHAPGGPQTAHGLWGAVVDVTGARKDAQCWLSHDAGRVRRFALWGWSAQPVKLTDGRFVEYRAWERPRIEQLAADREQIWAEAKWKLGEGIMPRVPERMYDAWADPWAPIIHALCDDALRRDKPLAQSVVLKAIGWPEGKQVNNVVGVRLKRLIYALAGMVAGRMSYSYEGDGCRMHYRMPKEIRRYHGPKMGRNF